MLPLLKDVGGRSSTTFATAAHRAIARRCFCGTPLDRPVSDQDHLHQILVKHARVAHVSVGEQRRYGMHSLRHTLATRLMEDGTPVERIADILGHQSVESTGVYLKSSLGLLARCAWIRTAQRGSDAMSAAIKLAGAIMGLSARNARSATSMCARSVCWPASRCSAPASSPG